LIDGIIRIDNRHREDNTFSDDLKSPRSVYHSVSSVVYLVGGVRESLYNQALFLSLDILSFSPYSGTIHSEKLPWKGHLLARELGDNPRNEEHVPLPYDSDISILYRTVPQTIALFREYYFTSRCDVSHIFWHDHLECK